MNTAARQAHWQGVYRTKHEHEVSWFQESADVSLDLIRATGVDPDAAIIDIGGGTSRLIDGLLLAGFRSLSVLDLSEAALATARARLGVHAANVNWVVADVTTWVPQHIYDVWHDRAAFHFLTDPGDRAAYAERVGGAVRPGGHIIVGTFAPDGPEKCSGLPVIRHDATSIGEALGGAFELELTRQHEHATPWGTIQHFQFSVFRRVD